MDRLSINTGASPIKRLLLFLVTLIFLLTSCEDYRDVRNDQIIYYYFEVSILDKINNNQITGLNVICRNNETKFLESIDSSKNGSYSVPYIHNADRHSIRLADAYISAYNSEFFGDTIISKSLFNSKVPVAVNIYVRPVGIVKLTLHNLTDIQKILISIFDGYDMADAPYNETIMEFLPSSADTTVFLPAHPNKVSYIHCYFDKTTYSKPAYATSVNINSADTVFLDYFH